MVSAGNVHPTELTDLAGARVAVANETEDGSYYMAMEFLTGKTLTFTSFSGGTAVNVTFGDGTNGTVKTLDQLNSKLQANNLTATIDANGLLTVSTTNDYASATIGSPCV